MVAFFTPPPFMASKVFQGTWTHGQSGGANSASPSFSSVTFGPEYSDRLIVVTITNPRGAGAVNPSAVTIGGVSATLVTQTTGTNTGNAMWMAVVPTGTVGTISITYPGAPASTTISVYSLTGYLSSTPYHTDNPAGAAAATRTTTINVRAGGIAIVSICYAANSNQPTGTLGAIYDYLNTAGGAGTAQGTASAKPVSDASGLTAIANCRCIMSASWR